MRCLELSYVPRLATILALTAFLLLQLNAGTRRIAQKGPDSPPIPFQPFATGSTRAQAVQQANVVYNEWLQKSDGATNDPYRHSASIRVDRKQAGPGILFFDDMESGVNGWTVSTHKDTLWHLTDRYAASGNTSWWLGRESTLTYNSGDTVDQSLTSPLITIPSDAEQTTLMFSQMYMTEAKWDICFVEVSADSGSNWTVLNPPGSSGFSYHWNITQIDLSAYAGSTIQVRFHFATQDALFNDYRGWMVDNVLVYEGSGHLGGVVYFDHNKDHNRDNLDAPLGSWAITIAGDGLVIKTSSDWNGLYGYALPYGDYTVTATVPTYWDPITPANAVQSVTLSPGAPQSDSLDFGFWRQMSLLTGYVFSDANHNGIRDEGETLVPNQYVILAIPGTSSYNWPWHRTDDSGYYSFAAYFTGAYAVYQQTGTWKVQTFPANNQPIPVQVANLFSTYDNLNFGDYFSSDPSAPTTSHIGGFVFNDENRNGKLDEHENGIQGITITASGPESRTAVTDSIGRFSFVQLHGGTYTIGATPFTGVWPMSGPPTQTTVQVLPDTGNDSLVFAFKVIRRSRAHGTVISDLNRNGLRDQGEPGVLGWKISLSGVDVYGAQVAVDTLTGPDGTFAFDSLWPGSYTLGESMQNKWVQTLPAGFSNIWFRVGVEGDASGLDFGNHFDSTFNTSYRSFVQESIAYSMDPKGKKWGPTKGILTGSDFSFFVVNNTGLPAQQLRLTFKYPIIDSLRCATPALQAIDTTHRKAFIITFPGEVQNGDTISMSGRSLSPGKSGMSFQTALWRVSLHDRKFKPTITSLTNRYCIPNAADMLMALNLPIKVGAGSRHDVIMKRYSDVGRSLFDPATFSIHTGAPRCLDTFDLDHKVMRKQYSSLRPSDQNNKLFAELTALRINILASEIAITPRGFGDLIFDEGGTNPFNGKSVRFIAAKADTFMSSYKDMRAPTPCSMPAGYESVTPGELWRVIRMIDSSFSGAMDYLSFNPKTRAMYLTATRSIDSVSYIHIDTTLWTSGNMNAIASKPEAREPAQFSLHQNYPNPFNPSTVITFTLPDQSQVTMKVYNLLGQEVASVLENESMTSGPQEVLFNGAQLASGVYFYRINARVLDANGAPGQAYTDLKKMVLLK